MAPELVCVGDNTVDVYVDEGVMYPGGNAVNVAVRATRLGVGTAYIGCLGDDQLGAVLSTALDVEGVDTSRLRVVAGPNAHAEVRLRDGDRVFTDGTAGVSAFVPDDGDLALASGARVVHTGECSLIEDHLGALRGAAQLLSFDFSERDWTYVVALAPYVDLAILSRPSGTADPRRVADAVLALGPTQVVVSTGAGGALWTDGDRTVAADAPPADVIDTLGAGDSLIARILAGVISEEDPNDFMPAATAYATASCMERGAFGQGAPFDRSTIRLSSTERQP